MTVKKLTVLFVVSIVGVCMADKPPFPLGHKTVEPPAGRLGYRIGSYLTIEGTREEDGKVGVNTLRVDTIDGYRLDKPIDIWIDNVTLPSRERCVLKGYETGRWIGVPDEVLRATESPHPQAVWQFQFYFLATSVEQPKSLKIK